MASAFCVRRLLFLPQGHEDILLYSLLESFFAFLHIYVKRYIYIFICNILGNDFCVRCEVEIVLSFSM